MIIVTSSFSKRSSSKSFCKIFSIHAKTLSQRLQIPPGGRAFSKSFTFVRLSVDGRPNRKIKRCVFEFLQRIVDKALSLCLEQEKIKNYPDKFLLGDLSKQRKTKSWQYTAIFVI